MHIILFISAALILVLYGGIVFYGKHFENLIKAHPTFSARFNEKYQHVNFQYAVGSIENLRKLRETYDLDRVAGEGSEIEQIINLMKWVYQLAGHAVNPTVPKELNSLNLIELCKTEKKKLNCWMHSIILNEVYLSMGYSSRIIHLKPHSGENKESHFVTSVYSNDLGRWIMMDADMCGYIKDEIDSILGIREIRQRLIADKSLTVNDDIGGFSKVLGKWSYTWYLRKNIFRYNCQQSSEFGQETYRSGRTYIELLPDGFREDLLQKAEVNPRGNKIIFINDESLFWQIP